jgi:hypothetical protein
MKTVMIKCWIAFYMLVTVSGCTPVGVKAHNLVAIGTGNDHQQLFSSGDLEFDYCYSFVLTSPSNKIPDDIKINCYDTELELVNKFTRQKSLCTIPSTYICENFTVTSNEVGFGITQRKPNILSQYLSDKEADFYITFYFETAGKKIPARFLVGKEFRRYDHNPFFRAFDENGNYRFEKRKGVTH